MVTAHPDAVASINSLAKRLSECGDFDQSRAYFEQAISADRSNASAYLGWVQTKTVNSSDKEMVQAMEGALSNRTIAEGDRMKILFALGKAHGDLGEYERSMRVYNEANEIRDPMSQRKQSFQRETSLSFYNLTQEIFSSCGHSEPSDPLRVDPDPIFIVGMFRSGTTLVEQILSNHSSVVAGGEIPYWMDVSAPCFEYSRTYL